MKTKEDDSSFSLYFVELAKAAQEFLKLDLPSNSNQVVPTFTSGSLNEHPAGTIFYFLTL